MPSAIDVAQRVIDTEIKGLEALRGALSEDFNQSVEMLLTLSGRVFVTGVGKSGHVARKIAATLASTGTPAIYIHPTEASHGDMGMLTKDDAVIALSRSGETKELSDITAFTQRFDIPLIAITAASDSALGRAAAHRLILPDTPEACAETRAPTTSTLLQMALGDALAVALLEAKGFTAGDFKTFHPAGSLGASLLTVSDIMHSGKALPLIDESANIASAIKIMSEKGFGCVGITQAGKLIGIITDGDLRRHVTETDNMAQKTVIEIMTRDPQTAADDDLAATALRRMTGENVQILQLFVVDKDVPIGIVHMHDFLRAGLI